MSKFNIPVQHIPTVESAYADVLGKNADNQIVDIQNENIIENNNQAFKIHEDTIEQLAQRIAQDGQISPCIVTPLPNGKYELIDGRHRRRAIIKAGLPTTKCIIKSNLSDKDKSVYRITLNVFRNNDYLPSELALSLKELVEIEGGSYGAVKKLAEETSTSRKKIYRYIRLTYLIKPLLNKVDNGDIPLIAAVELSYLTETQQNRLFEFLLNHSECKINTEIARMIKESPENLEEIFYSDCDDEDEVINVDNLSTFDGDEILETSSKNKEVDNLSTFDGNEILETSSKNKEVDNLSTFKSRSEINVTDNVNLINEKTRLEITKLYINTTKIDIQIISNFLSTNESMQYIKEQYIKTQYAEHTQNNSFEFKNKFLYKSDDNENTYIIPYNQLDAWVRNYIRVHYTKEQIISIISKGVD